MYKVKAVIKSTLDKTFIRDNQDEMETTPLVILALDKDMVSPEDDIECRIANSAPIYKVVEEEPVYEYYVKVEEPCEQRILLAQEEEYKFNLYYNQDKVKGIDFEFSSELKGIIEKNWGNYYKMEKVGSNKITIKNLKSCNRGPIIITAKCKTPNGEEVKQSYEIELGGFY